MLRNLLKLTMIAAFFTACASKPKDVSNEARGEQPAPKTQASMEAKQLAAEQESQYVTEISFKPGSTELTKTSRQKLERLLNSVKDQEKIDQVEVVSWADQAYPSKEKRKLSKEQQKLAEERNRSIQIFLKTQNKSIPVKLHNMAVRPSTLIGMWGGSDAKIKNSLESSGLTTVGNQAKASQAIVMIEIK